MLKIFGKPIRACLNNKGEAGIDSLVGVMVFFLMLSIALSFLPLFSAKQKLNQFADEIVRAAEIQGGVYGEVDARIAQMKNATGLNPEISWAGTAFYGGSKVQLNGEIKCSLLITKSLNNGHLGIHIPVRIRSLGSGKSEVYYK